MAMLTGIMLCTASAHSAVSLSDWNSSTGLEVTSVNAVESVGGKSRWITYGFQANQAGTSDMSVSIEAGTRPFRLTRWCASVSPATATAASVITVRRRTTASSGGTVFTSDGTGSSNTAHAFQIQTDGSLQGVARLGGSVGTAGPTLDQYGMNTGEMGATQLPNIPWCRNYDADSGKAPLIMPGVNNGISITISSSGSGAGTSYISSISIMEDIR